MLVEDEPSVRTAISEALREQGCTVVVAANGYDALLVAQQHAETHLLPFDVVMPLMSGSEPAA